MKVLLIGSGGREHALAFKIAQSSKLDKLYIAPGNPGMKSLGELVNISAEDNDAILSFCKNNKIDLVVIGPEIPLMNGLSDLLRENGFAVFGPGKNAALIEGAKSFAKEIMKKYGVPTADYCAFTKDNYEGAVNYLKASKYPVVIKANGLAAGKGVTICADFREAVKSIDDCFKAGIFGPAGDALVIEEFLEGEEASIFAITDGKDFICLPPAQDHKRIGDGDTGKNTGGMGSYAPAPVVTNAILKEVEEKIISKTLQGMMKENKTFSGCLYCGIIITKQGPKVIEFNCRFGDPETQAVLPLLEGDMLDLLYSSACGKLNKSAVKYSGGSAVCVVAASKGYPDKFEKGFEITGLDDASGKDVIVFCAGVKEENGKLVSNGGRVLGVTAVRKENNIKACKDAAYNALSKINFQNIYFRKDISDKAINRK